MRVFARISNYLQLFIRWVELYTRRFILGLLLISCSVIMVWEPGWIISAIDALRIPYAIFLVAFVMFFFLRSNYALATAGGIALLIIAPGIWPYFKTANETPAERRQEKKAVVEADITILHFNVKENNKKIQTVAEAALSSGATIVSLQELRPASFRIVDSLMRNKYPYRYSELDYPGFGMALYSQIPLADTQTIAQEYFPLLYASVRAQGQTVHLLAGTTSTPTNDKDFKQQAAEFTFMAQQVQALEGPVVLMGDMNAVPWSEHMQALLEKTQLLDSRKDLSATYPAQSPMQIPIDYILHSRHIRCVQFTTVGGTSSNHLGLMGYYRIPPTR